MIGASWIFRRRFFVDDHLPEETTKWKTHHTTKCQKKPQNGLLTTLPNARRNNKMKYSPDYQMPGETTKWNTHHTAKCQEKQQNEILEHHTTKCQEKQ